MKIQVQPANGTLQGEQFYTIQLTNNNKMRAVLLNYGATLTELWTPDRNGQLADVVLGAPAAAAYLHDHPCFGSTIGRFANRINGAAFQIEGENFELTANHGTCMLHGGPNAFHHKIWQFSTFVTDESCGVHFTLLDPHGYNGFPGNLWVQTTYTLTHDNKLIISYIAHTDKTTHINLTHHSYFNLSGMQQAHVGHHQLRMAAHAVLETDAILVPTGKLLDVHGTDFDFNEMQALMPRLQETMGYDACFMLNKTRDEWAATLLHPHSGRRMQVYTNLPAIQLYTANHFDGESYMGKRFEKYQRFAGICLEAQYAPDSPNKPEFASTLLHAGETYSHYCTYAFDIAPE